MSHHVFPWRAKFLEALAEVPVVQYACDAVGIERSTAYRARKDDETFAADWADALEAGIDRAEREAFRRGVEGFNEPLTHQGQITYQVREVIDPDTNEKTFQRVLDANGQPIPVTVRKHSDALLALVLKGRRKQVYSDRTEITGADGGAVKQQTVIITGVPNVNDFDPNDFA